ncbi:hypothetical protein BJ170DRAFT_283845 [Xylariales sp. AK1849]|nr:hypothetical protein BJ170DRAFT_283845 [Xylariales sp. AK1849]
MAYRGSTGELVRGDRWDRDRFAYERDRDRQGDEKERYEEHDHFYSRGPGGRVRETSVDDRYERRTSRPYDDDHVRDKRYYEEESRFRRSPPPEFERKVVIEKERGREYRDASPPRRPGALLRRQSSLDTFDRRPPARFYEREEYGPPARRGDYRPDPYQPIPLPRSRALPPPRIYAERDFEEIRVAEPDRFGDEEFHAYPERIREREVTRERRRRDHSVESKKSRASHASRAHTHHSSVRSSSKSSSTSSSSGGTTVTVKSEYPKKGKTRIPSRLVSKRALIDLGYPFDEEGNTIIVQKALGQENIDDLLKLSEDYKKSELEVVAARSDAGNLVEERRTEIFTVPPPAPQTVYAPPPQSVVTPYIIEAERREISEEIPVGPLALVADRRRDDRAIKAEIARLEAERELIRRDRRHHHHSHSPGGELVRAERLSSGELVLYEEQVEKIEEPRRGVRIEKDKKGPPPGVLRAMLATLT